MSTITPNMFQTYTHTEQEALSCSIFTQTNLEYLHNLRTAIAAQKLNVTYDPAKPMEFVQEEAFLKGQLDILTYIIDSSAEGTNNLHSLASQSAVTEVSHNLNESPVARIFGDN